MGMSGNASSAGSSPRKLKGKLAIVTKDTSTPTPLASRPACHTSALHSSWILRIIPLQAYKQPATHSYTKVGGDFDRAVVSRMEIEEEEEEDNTFDFNKSDNPSRSWLTVRKSVDDMQSSPLRPSEVDFVLLKTDSAESGEFKASTSLDSKVVPVLEDIAEVSAEEDQDDEGSAAQVDKGKSLKKTIRSFPPLKSGEQWPGTLKPTGLPPLRILANRDKCVRPVRAELPLLTPVSVPWVVDEKKTNALQEENQQASNTCSLPSNFVGNFYRGSEHTKSLPERFLDVGSVHSSSSDSTKSLSEDFLATNIHPAVESASRDEEITSLRKSKENSFSRIVSNSAGRSNQSLHRSRSRSGQSSRQQQQQQEQIPCSNEQEEKDRVYVKTRKERLAGAGKAVASSSHHSRAEQLPVRGSQQWLQRWCSPNSTLHVIKGSET